MATAPSTSRSSRPASRWRARSRRSSRTPLTPRSPIRPRRPPGGVRPLGRAPSTDGCRAAQRRSVRSAAPGAARARWPIRSSKPAGRCNPTVGRFDSCAAPFAAPQSLHDGWIPGHRGGSRVIPVVIQLRFLPANRLFLASVENRQWPSRSFVGSNPTPPLTDPKPAWLSAQWRLLLRARGGHLGSARERAAPGHRARSAPARPPVFMSSALVSRTGGVVSQLAGDGVMAQFGDAPRLAM